MNIPSLSARSFLALFMSLDAVPIIGGPAAVPASGSSRSNAPEGWASQSGGTSGGAAGKVDVVNNLYASSDADYACGPGVEIRMLIENNDFRNSGYAIRRQGGDNPPPAWMSIGNIGTAKDIAANQGTVFTPPYTLSPKPAASEAEAGVRPAAVNVSCAIVAAGKEDG